MDKKGFLGDRRFMVVYPAPKSAWKNEWAPNDSTHRFLTQRQCPSLATVVATLEDNYTTLVLVNKNSKAIRIPIADKTGKSLRAGIWDEQVLVQDMGDEAAKFLQIIVNQDKQCCVGDEGEATGGSGSLYRDIRLVQQSSEDVRKCNDTYTPAASRSTISGDPPPVALTDGFPILIANQASLDQVNEKLIAANKPTIPMSRFRPNIVVRTPNAFDEDSWKLVAIGDQLFAVVKACPRCKQSCTDQETGQVTTEPVTIMKSFRNLGESNEDVFFAQNAIPLTHGTVRVGDSVRVLQQGDPVYK